MFKKFCGLITGREKKKDENISFCEALLLLYKVNKGQLVEGINLEGYVSKNRPYKFSNLSPDRASDDLSIIFGFHGSYRGRYRIFERAKFEVHHIILTQPSNTRNSKSRIDITYTLRV